MLGAPEPTHHQIPAPGEQKSEHAGIRGAVNLHCGGNCPMHCGVFCCISHFYAPPDTHTPVVTTKMSSDIDKCPWKSKGAKEPLVRTTGQREGESGLLFCLCLFFRI